MLSESCCNANTQCTWVTSKALENKRGCQADTSIRCTAQTIDNCKITEGANHGDILSSTGNKTRCADNYTGSCSYECYGGTWHEVGNQCKANCNGELLAGNCNVSPSNHNQTSGSCANGYPNGSCSYTCNNGTWATPSNNTCARANNCTKGNARCNTLTLAHDQGPTSPSCKSNYTGRCNFGKCNNGSMTLTDTCKRKCITTWSPDTTKCDNLTLNLAHNQRHTGNCKSGYTGTCTYTCTNGTPGGSSAGCTQAVCQLSMLSSYCIPYNGYASWSGNPGYVDISGQSRTFTNNTNVFCVRQKIMHSPPFSHIVKEFRYSFLRCDNGSWRTRNYRNCQAKPNVTTTFNGRTYSQPYLSHNTTITLAAVGISYLLCHCFDGRGRCYIDQSH